MTVRWRESGVWALAELLDYGVCARPHHRDGDTPPHIKHVEVETALSRRGAVVGARGCQLPQDALEHTRAVAASPDRVVRASNKN